MERYRSLDCQEIVLMVFNHRNKVITLDEAQYIWECYCTVRRTQWLVPARLIDVLEAYDRFYLDYKRGVP